MDENKCKGCICSICEETFPKLFSECIGCGICKPTTGVLKKIDCLKYTKQEQEKYVMQGVLKMDKKNDKKQCEKCICKQCRDNQPEIYLECNACHWCIGNDGYVEVCSKCTGKNDKPRH